MASLFWVGGSGNYDGVTTNFATVSGGTATVAAVTSADTVTFDANSGTAATITTSVAMSASTVLVNKSDLTFSLGNTLTTAGVMNLSSGTFVTNGNACNLFSFSSTTATSRTLTMGASTITLTGTATVWTTATTTGLVITANTATVTCSSNARTYSLGNANYNGTTFSFTGAGACSVSHAGATIGNLTRIGTAAKTDSLDLSVATLTITGTLTLTGNSRANQLLCQAAGTAGSKAILSAASVSATSCDFQDITGAGAASWNFSAQTDIGDCQGNTNITFPTSTTRFWIGGTGVWSSATKWSTSSGGSAGTTIPLPQDDIVFDNNSGATLAFTVDMTRLGRSIDFSSRTNSTTLTTSVSNFIYGSLNLNGPTWTTNWASPITFAGRGSYTINSGTRLFTGTANNITAPSGTYTLASDITFGASSATAITLVNGTFDANGFNVSVSGTGSGTRFAQGGGTLNMGSGTWSIPAVGGGTFWSQTGGTLNAGTSTIVTNGASATTKTFVGGNKVYNDLTYTVAGSTAALVIQGTNTFHDLNFSDGTSSRTMTFSGNQTLTGTLNMTGTALAPLTLNSSTAGTARSIIKTSGTVSLDYVSIQDSTATGGASFYAGANSTNVSGNTGWIFSAPPGLNAPLLTLMGVG